MAKTATVEDPKAPPADAAAEEAFEVSLPDADAGEQPLRLDTEETEPEPDALAPKPAPEPVRQPAVEAVAPPKKKPEAKPAEPAPPLPAAAREERAKRKVYAQKWATALAERDAALAEINRLRTGDGQPRQPDATLQRHLEDLKQKAEGADSMGKLMELNLGEMDRRDRLVQEQIAQIRYEHALALSQMTARMQHSDYDAVLQKAGIYAALQTEPGTGQARDPELARRIYLTRDGRLRADPAEEAYQLALGRIEYEAGLKGEEPEEPEPPKKKVARAASESEPEAEAEEPATGKKETASEAERRGAQKVIDVVSRNSSRPKGIGGLRSAGTPGSARLTRAQLDELMEREPATYQRLVKANPDLERWHLGG